MNKIKIIKEKLKRILKINKKIYIEKYKKYKEECLKNNQKEFIIFNTPIHGNVGDHAIIFAELKMLEKLNIKAFEVPTFDEMYYFDYIKNNISQDATIAITGGGFIGSQWIIEEKLVNKVINTFKNNKIIIFPATFYFKSDKFGKKELEKTKKIFKEAKDLIILAREEKTYDFICENYKNSLNYLVPDIVLSLNMEFDEDRKGILLCLRKDVEGNLNNDIKKHIINIANKYDEIKFTDTVVNYNISIEEREKEITAKINEFASSNLVITDRLHGMIFAYITNTPCIVLGNYNYKVKGVYERWIKNLNNRIVFVENINEIEKNIQKLKTIPYTKNNELSFEKIIKILEEN